MAVPRLSVDAPLLKQWLEAADGLPPLPQVEQTPREPHVAEYRLEREEDSAAA